MKDLNVHDILMNEAGKLPAGDVAVLLSGGGRLLEIERRVESEEKR